MNFPQQADHHQKEGNNKITFIQSINQFKVSVLLGNEILLVTEKCIHNALEGGKLCDIFTCVVSHSKLFQQMLSSSMCIYNHRTRKKKDIKPKTNQNTTTNLVKKLTSVSILQKLIGGCTVL